MEKNPGLQRSHIWPSMFSLQLQTPETGSQLGWLPYEPGTLQLHSRQPCGRGRGEVISGVTAPEQASERRVQCATVTPPRVLRVGNLRAIYGEVIPSTVSHGTTKETSTRSTNESPIFIGETHFGVSTEIQPTAAALLYAEVKDYLSLSSEPKPHLLNSHQCH